MVAAFYVLGLDLWEPHWYLEEYSHCFSVRIHRKACYVANDILVSFVLVESINVGTPIVHLANTASISSKRNASPSWTHSYALLEEGVSSGSR